MTERVEEFYSDVYFLRSSPWGVSITFAVTPPKDGIEGHDVCLVRMSHQTAKSLSMMLRKQLKTYERGTKTEITIPLDVMNKLELAPEDW